MKIRHLTPRARISATVGVIAVGALALSGCAGDGTSANYVEGGTFVYALGTDIGSLDPALGVTSAALAVGQYAYDPLVHLNEEGEIIAGLAKEWNVDGTTVSFTLRDDVTCADGAKFTATTAKGNLDFIGDPENASPLLGAFVPVGATIEADDEAGTLTLELAAPSPFVIEALSNVVMVCDKGLADRESIVTATDGTGPFVLDEAVANDHYTYSVRDGYKWGPDGATTDEKGMPAQVEFRVIPNETTAANLLVSGDINAAQIVGPDAARLTDLQATSSQLVLGEGWFNQAPDRVTADLAVRTALVQALDLDALANVASSGTGKRATQLAVVDPAPCQGGDFTSAFPAPALTKPQPRSRTPAGRRAPTGSTRRTASRSRSRSSTTRHSEPAATRQPNWRSPRGRSSASRSTPPGSRPTSSPESCSAVATGTSSGSRST